MRFQSLTDAEINAQQKVLSQGIVDFTISKAEEAVSKNSGKDMLKLVLKVWDCHGVEGLVYDYITASPKMAWKLKHFFESIGQGEQYQKGTINSEELIGKSGKAILAMQSDKTGQYGDKIGVKDYMEKVGEDKVKNDLPDFTSKDEDVPF